MVKQNLLLGRELCGGVVWEGNPCVARNQDAGAVLECREWSWRKVGEVRAAYGWNSACLVEDDDGCWPHGVGFQPVVLLSTGRKEGRKEAG